MGLLSGRHSNDPDATTTTGHHKGTHGDNNVGEHRYETRSRRLFRGRSSVPGTTTGTGTNTSGMSNNAPVANPTATHSAGLTQPNTVESGSNTTPTAGHARTQIIKGKIEGTIGKFVGSRNMMMKGNAKIEQGEAEKVAAGHLTDADRLENEAVEKRHMAGVGPGVHSTSGNARGGLRH